MPPTAFRHQGPPSCKLALLLPLRRQELANLAFKNIVRDNNELEIRLAPAPDQEPQAVHDAAHRHRRRHRRGIARPWRRAGRCLIPLTKSGKAFSRLDAISASGSSANWFAFPLARSASVLCLRTGRARHRKFLHHRRASQPSATRASWAEPPAHITCERESGPADAMVAWDRILMHAAEHGLWPRQMEAAGANVVPLTATRSL